MYTHPHFPTCIYIKKLTQISDFICGGIDAFCLQGIITKYLILLGKNYLRLNNKHMQKWSLITSRNFSMQALCYSLNTFYLVGTVFGLFGWLGFFHCWKCFPACLSMVCSSLIAFCLKQPQLLWPAVKRCLLLVWYEWKWVAVCCGGAWPSWGVGPRVWGQD